jgi:cytochrome c5
MPHYQGKKMQMSWKKLAVVAGLAGLLMACGDKAPEVTLEERAVIIAQAEELMPEDAELAEIYEYSCYSCHANPQTGAPLTGDVAAWAPRLEKGMDVMMDSTINGFEGMPPLGMCMDCSEDQFVALIEFMSGTRGGASQ